VPPVRWQVIRSTLFARAREERKPDNVPPASQGWQVWQVKSFLLYRAHTYA